MFHYNLAWSLQSLIADWIGSKDLPAIRKVGLFICTHLSLKCNLTVSKVGLSELRKMVNICSYYKNIYAVSIGKLAKANLLFSV